MPPSPDETSPPYERFVELLLAHEPKVRAFLRALLPVATDVDDVMQETSLVAWRKFASFDLATNFGAWLTTIARFEALRHRRDHARDRLCFSPEVFELLAEETAAAEGARSRERAALEFCLEKLEAREARLLRLAYQPGARMHTLAAEAGKSAPAFYKTIQRLRATLLECVARALREEGIA
ncbi:MAG: sigma-70 family RNA polymerase sigma factor [Verrucomicrobiota bacterium]|nr:sigma-70 family RNA polymerase sigma factor [Verrucomicrobiota bacterium]